ncbi:MAG TPA: glutamate formimidoyltransferase [Thermoanaerobaculia bacterium]|nr:glutamate formimidoyltransferase [Thermoanaerobaculia bacterium]
MIEAVPNVSEGRDRGTIDRIASAVSSVPAVRLLHVGSDEDHNRTVLTYVSDRSDALAQATLALYDAAVGSIDLRRHSGEHPRVGAVDVCPFVPLAGSTMADCVALAREVGREIAARFEIPVYLYEEAATRPERRELPRIRSGQFEGFTKKIARPEWKPDFGPDRVHPSAGVTVVGARVLLIAFNVQLATDRLDLAEAIARSARGVSGGLRFVRALPIRLAHRGIVQVSMNLLDYRRTPIHRAFNLVREEAARWGVEILSSEIVGLVPAEALWDAAAWHLRLENFSPSIILETRLGAQNQESER